MKKIGFLLDPDPGHIYPMLGLYESLVSAEYEVHLLGLEDIRNLTGLSYNYHVIFNDLYPRGFLLQYKQMQEKNNVSFLNNDIPRPHLCAILEGALTPLLNGLFLDLLIVPYSLSLETCLLKHVYPSLRMLFFTTWLRPPSLTPERQAVDVFNSLAKNLKESITQHISIENISVLTSLVKDIPEMIPCPMEFELPGTSIANYGCHVGPLLRTPGKRSDFFENIRIDLDCKIVYCSLGSQTALFAERALKIFNTVYECFSSEDASGLYLILNVGDVRTEFKSVIGKIEIVRWAPQLEILEKAAVMITHGGLGTIKECVAYQVPMIVVPMIYDQYDNANRVQYHGIGSVLEDQLLTTNKLATAIKSLITDELVKENIKRMNMVFETKSNLHLDVILSLVTEPALRQGN